MPFPKSFLPGSRMATFLTWTIVAIACGSRTSTDFDLFEEGGTQGQGGRSSSTTSSVTTSSSVTTGSSTVTTTGGVAGSGFGGFAGFGGFGTAGSAVVCPCAPLSSENCPPGTQVGAGPGPCFCPSCVACTFGCPAIACASGSHFETQPGQCCGNCVPDAKSCDVGMKQYDMGRQPILDKLSSVSCSTDNDCAVAPEGNQCVARCGVPLRTSEVGAWVNTTDSLAAMSCFNCPRPPPTPCPAPFVRCIGNRCAFGAPK
jgi:hypothetical protein